MQIIVLRKNCIKTNTCLNLRKNNDVWRGNHRVTRWLRRIERHYSNDERWHYSMDCNLLDPKGSIGDLLDVVNDVNWLV